MFDNTRLLQLREILQKFDATILYTDEQLQTSYEFLFGGRKFVPFQGNFGLAELLGYLKENMFLLELNSLNELTEHYKREDKSYEEFLLELTMPQHSDTIYFARTNTLIDVSKVQPNPTPFEMFHDVTFTQDRNRHSFNCVLAPPSVSSEHQNQIRTLLRRNHTQHFQLDGESEEELEFAD